MKIFNNKNHPFFICFLVILLLTGCNSNTDDIFNIKKIYNDYIINYINRGNLGKDSEKLDNIANESSNINLVRLSTGKVKSLNPLVNGDSRVDDILKLVYIPFIKIDNNFKAVNSIAKSWEINENGLTGTFQIKDNLKWQDGSNINAYDVEYSFNTIKNSPSSSMYKNLVNYIKSIKAVNEYSVVIEFWRNFSNNIMTLDFPVIKNNSFTNNDIIGVSSGYYYIEEYVESSHIMLNVNTHSMNNDVFDISKNDYFSNKKIQVSLTESFETDVLGFEAGLYDILISKGLYVGRYAPMHIDYNIYTYPTLEYDFIGFNSNNTLLSEEIRQGIAYSIDKARILDEAYLGYSDISSTPIHPKSWLYDSNVESYNYNNNKAISIFRDNNFIDRDKDRYLEYIVTDGIDSNDVEKYNKFTVRLLLNKDSIIQQEIGNVVKENLEEIGIGVIIEAYNFEEYEERFKASNFDLVVGSLQMSKAGSFRDIFGTDGEFNYINYSNDDVDYLIGLLDSAITDKDKILYSSRLQAKLSHELPHLSIAYRQGGYYLKN